MPPQMLNKSSDEIATMWNEIAVGPVSTCTLSGVDWKSQWLNKPFRTPDLRTDKEKVWDILSNHDDIDAAIIYAHLKSISNKTPLNIKWQQQ